MIDEELEMLAIITSLFQELLHPLINLNASVEILNGKVPAKAVSIVDDIENNSKELKKKVHYLYGNVRQVFNLKSPDDVVSNLHQNDLPPKIGSKTSVRIGPVWRQKPWQKGRCLQQNRSS